MRKILACFLTTRIHPAGRGKDSQCGDTAPCTYEDPAHSKEENAEPPHGSRGEDIQCEGVSAMTLSTQAAQMTGLRQGLPMPRACDCF